MSGGITGNTIILMLQTQNLWFRSGKLKHLPVLARPAIKIRAHDKPQTFGYCI